MKLELNEYVESIIKMVCPEFKERGKDMSLEELSEVLQKDGDRVRRLKTYRQSQATKHAWREKRCNFMQGINRFNRNEKTTDFKKGVMDKLKGWGKISPFKGEEESDSDKLDKVEWYEFAPTGYFDLYEFLGELTMLESLVYETAGTFTLDDQFLESSVFADAVCEDIGKFKSCLINDKPVPANIFETVLMIADNYDKKDGSLCERFSKFIKEKKKGRKNETIS